MTPPLVSCDYDHTYSVCPELRAVCKALNESDDVRIEIVTGNATLGAHVDGIPVHVVPHPSTMSEPEHAKAKVAYMVSAGVSLVLADNSHDVTREAEASGIAANLFTAAKPLTKQRSKGFTLADLNRDLSPHRTGVAVSWDGTCADPRCAEHLR